MMEETIDSESRFLGTKRSDIYVTFKESFNLLDLILHENNKGLD